MNYYNRPLAYILYTLWLFFAVLKFSFTFNVFLSANNDMLLLSNFLFWLIGGGVITYRLLIKPIKLNISIPILLFLSFLTLLNSNVFAFIFNLIVWFVISEMIKPKYFKLIYAGNILLLIIIFYMSTIILGDTYYHDLRYGDVKTFGFENSNSFPQLLIIFFLFFSLRFKWVLLLALTLLIIFYDDIKTRSFYIILAFYPLMLLVSKYVQTNKWYLLPYFLFLSTAVLIYYYYTGSTLAIKLDELLSYRISFANIIISYIGGYTALILGSKLTPEASMLPLDMSYLAVLINYGLFPSLLLMILYSRGLKRMTDENMVSIVSLIVSFLVYCLIENILVSFLLNPTFYYLFYFINNKSTIHYNSRYKVTSNDS